MLQYLLAHYKDIILAIISVDVALMPLFPAAGILGKIKDFLSKLVA